jgi:hypothetical protein
MVSSFLAFSADIVSNFRVLQNMLLIIIYTNSLFLDGCHKSSYF